jgi:hypothetical protein
MGIIEKLLRGKSRTAEVVGAELANARLAAERAVEAREKAEADYSASLLDESAAASRKAREALTDAAVAVDRSNALVRGLEAQLREACEFEAEAERKQAYSDAKRLAAEGRKALSRYPSVAGELLDLLAVVARAEAAVFEANRDLPDNAAPLPPIEEAIRTLPGEPREVISRKTREAWIFSESGRLVDAAIVGMIKLDAQDRRRGTIASVGSFDGKHTPVELRKVEEVTSRPALQPLAVDSLASGIKLPAFHPGAPEVWSGDGPTSYGSPFGQHAQALLQQIDAARERLKAKPADTRPRPMVRTEIRVIDEERIREASDAA